MTKPIDMTEPEIKEGYEVVIRNVRWQRYKPDGQRQMRKAGRWQRSNGYGGWINCEEPETVYAELPIITKAEGGDQ